MGSKARQFMKEQREFLSERARNLRKAPVEIARTAAVRAAERIKSLKDPVRAFSHSGVRLTAISQGTAQSLIELQAEIVTAALSNAATQLERAAQTESVAELARDQADVLRSARERIVDDLNKAVAIFKDAGGAVRKVARQTRRKVAGEAQAEMAAAKKTVRKAKRKVARRTPARTRKARA